MNDYSESQSSPAVYHARRGLRIAPRRWPVRRLSSSARRLRTPAGKSPYGAASQILDNLQIPVYTAIMQKQDTQPDRDVYTRVAALCTCTNLRRTSRVITQLYDAFLQPSGLLATQFTLLTAIAAYGPIALTPLAEGLAMDPTTLARNLKPLERDRRVAISTGQDRRTRVVRITEQGLDALSKALPLWEEAQARVISQMGENRWRTILGDWTEMVALVHQR